MEEFWKIEISPQAETARIGHLIAINSFRVLLCLKIAKFSHFCSDLDSITVCLFCFVEFATIANRGRIGENKIEIWNDLLSQSLGNDYTTKDVVTQLPTTRLICMYTIEN